MSLSKISISSAAAISRPSSPEASGTSDSQQAEGALPAEFKRPALPPEDLPPSKRPRTAATHTSSLGLAPRQQASLPRGQPELPAAPQSGADGKQILVGVIGRLRQEIEAADGTAQSKDKKLLHLQVLERRAAAHVERLSSNLETLYGGHQDIPAVLEMLLEVFIAKGLERPDELKDLDARRERDPNWFSTHKSIASSLYVDVHSGTLSNLERDISLFKLLNINMLHFMPTIYKTPEKDNDGGYAISDFRSLNPAIGTMDELRDLFNTLRKNGISPIMEVTINHVADDHEWVKAAKAGDPEKLAFFHVVDEAQKNDYDRHVEIWRPHVRPSNFTWNDDIGSHVWTSFMSSQWDVNYNNPKLLGAMAEEMMFLLNQGADVLRMDAVPYIWKEPGTKCKSMPKVQPVLGVFNAMNRIAAPGAVLLSEAITAPEDTTRYLGTDKCQLAYNAMAQAYLWDALSHEDTAHLAEVLKRHGNAPEGTAFLNIVRTHDNAIFEFDAAAAKAIGIDEGKRQRSLKEFFIKGNTYAAGIPFVDATSPSSMTFVNGTTGSLAGVETAVKAGDAQAADAAVQRIKLLKSVLLALPGVPVVNFTGGDDRGQISDYSFKDDEIKRHDTRWANRVPRNIDFSKKTQLEIETMNKVFNDTVDLNRIRTQQMPAFGAGPMQVIDTGAAPVLGFTRASDEQKVLVLGNFSASPQKIEPQHLMAHSQAAMMVDKLDPKTRPTLAPDSGIELAPYQCMWLVRADHNQAQSR